MGKKLISVAIVAVLMLSMASTAFAASLVGRYRAGGYGGCGGYGYSLMRDVDGNFLSQESFKANLDQAIADGYILEEDRQFYLNMFDYCVQNGGFGRGGCGGGRGFGSSFSR